MFVLDRMLIGTIRFVLDKVVAAAAAEMDNEEGLRERLLEAQMRQELGEITAEEFAQIEADVIVALRDVKARREGGGDSAIPEGMNVVGASAEMSGDVHDHHEGEGGESFATIDIPAPPPHPERAQRVEGPPPPHPERADSTRFARSRQAPRVEGPPSKHKPAKKKR